MSNMTCKICQGWLFVVLYIVERTFSACLSPYLDLCKTKGNTINVTDNEIGYEDIICNCEQMMFCFVVELQCNSNVIKFDSPINITSSSQLICNVSSLDSQRKSVLYEILNESENEVSINIVIDSEFGKYKIVCNAFEISEQNNSAAYSQWDIIKINPNKIIVDSKLKLRLTLIEQHRANLTPWCFIESPDGNVEILSTSWHSDTKVDCVGFSPVVSGMYTVSLGTALTPDIFDKSVSVEVTAKHPIAHLAQYSYDFQTIYIYFNENIELLSNCAKVFSEDSQYYFGVDYRCYTRANILLIRMGAQFKIISNITLNVNNKICQAGCQNVHLCLPALPVNLSVLKPKLPGQNFSLHINSVCAINATQKYMNVEVVPSKFFNLTVYNESLIKTSRNSQRKNLMFWRMMRKVQNKLSSRFVLQMNTSNIEPLLESLSSIDNVLDVNKNDLRSAARVFIFIQSSPASAAVLAEADVTFCQDPFPLFRFKWFVNEKYVFENGKLLILKNLTPGKYTVKCMIVSYNSTEILGEGWATTEILPNDEQVLVVPMEMTVSTADDIYLRAVTWLGTPVSWTCRFDLDEPCLTTDKKLIGEIIDLNSPRLFIPSGTLPVGSYIWAVENVKGSNEAKVFVKEGNVTAVGVEISSVFVKPFQEIVLNGTVRRIWGECRAWWSSVRRKGFNYLDLSTVGAGEDIFFSEQLPTTEIPFAIPFSFENRNGAESDTFYLFELQVFCSSSSRNKKGSFDYVKVPLVVSESPRVLPLTAEPLTGKAMITEFAISGGEAEASPKDYPLTYEWSYVDPCDSEVLIKRGVFVRNFTTFLPPGEYKLIVRVCNGRKICSTTLSPTISIIQDSKFPVENFQKARSQIQYLMASGEFSEAFGLTITVFKSLAFLAEPETREEIFSTVEESIKDKIEDFTKRAHSGQKNMNLFLEFFDRAIVVVKYFRKDSDILNHLMEFKTNILTKDNIANQRKF